MRLKIGMYCYVGPGHGLYRKIGSICIKIRDSISGSELG